MDICLFRDNFQFLHMHAYRIGLPGLSQQNIKEQEFIFHSFTGWKFNVEVSAGLGSLEPFLLEFQIVTILLCPHTVFPLCASIPGISPEIFSSYKDTS